MRNTTDIHNNEEKQVLCEELVKWLKEVAQKLKKLGMTEKEITYLLQTEQPLVQLTIDRNSRIFLGNNRIEVHMEPLSKAVYLLFLRHPEGIFFKDLPDYREELVQIYVKLKPYGMNGRVAKSIEDVTNPLRNSINEKCSKIRKAFVSVLDNRMASHYSISGQRGKAKKITLPRDLVVWEDLGVSLP